MSTTTSKKTSKKKLEVEVNNSEVVNNQESDTVENKESDVVEQELKIEEKSNEVSLVSKEEIKKSFEELDSLPSTQNKTSWIWIRDTNGRPSMSATFASVAFWVTTLSYILSMFVSIGPLQFREFDVAACGAYLVPILTLYFSRRWTTDNLEFKKNSNNSGE